MIVSDGWTSSSLGDVLVVDFDGTWGEESDPKNGVAVLRSTNMRGNALSFSDVARRNVPMSVLSRKRLLDGDILVNKSSGSAHLVGASVLFVSPDDRPYLCSNFIRCLRPDSSKVVPEFLHYSLQSPQFRSQVFGAQRTTSGLRNLKLDEYKAGRLSYPSKEEQCRIVARIKECMERVNEVEKLREQAKLEAACLELATFHDAIEEGINQRGWPLGILGDVASSFRYGTSAKAHTEQMGTPILRMGNIENGYFHYRDLKFIQLDDRDLNKYRLKCGDILINRTNSLELVGKAATFDQEGGDWVYASYLVCVDVDRSRVVPEFVTAVINSRMGRDYVLATARRAIGMVNINAKEMARFPMPLPPLKDQVAIVERLSAVRVCAQSLRDEIDDPGIEQLRSAFLRRAFAGEL